MTPEITLVDRGRGLQLSTHRVRVQDLVPYFQDGCSYEEILRYIPTLTREEISVVERYYREHQQDLDEEDRLIQVCEEQRKNPKWVQKILEEGRADRQTIMEQLRREESNGAPE